MKTLIYGYMRVHSEAEDEDIRHMELELKNFAEVKDFCFAAIFYESFGTPCLRALRLGPRCRCG